MPHRHLCQLRRADLHGDGNLGNVAYVEHLQAARVGLLASLGLSSDLRESRLVVEYAAPARLEHEPVTVEVWVCDAGEGTLSLGYEMTSSAGVHARAVTEHVTSLSPAVEGPPPLDARGAPWSWSGGNVRPTLVRPADLGPDGTVSTHRHLDLSNEATTAEMVGVFRSARVEGGVSTVIVRTELDLLSPVRWRATAYDVAARVAGLGRTSLVLESETRDGNTVLARCRIVEVGVDDDGAPQPWHEAHRAGFEARLAP